jgi:acyl carrier protein
VKIGALLAPLFPELGRPLAADDSPATVATWDSLKQTEVVLAVEEAFHVDLTTREILDLKSVASLVAILRQRGLDVDP